jgi:hypothetical protein
MDWVAQKIEEARVAGKRSIEFGGLYYHAAESISIIARRMGLRATIDKDIEELKRPPTDDFCWLGTPFIVSVYW